MAFTMARKGWGRPQADLNTKYLPFHTKRTLIFAGMAVVVVWPPMFPFTKAWEGHEAALTVKLLWERESPRNIPGCPPRLTPFTVALGEWNGQQRLSSITDD